jgi:hypothetical protein
MKLIAAIQGVAAVRVSLDEVLPPSNPPQLNIVAGVQSFFNFSTSPPREVITGGVPLVFQFGRVIDPETKTEIGINQLAMLPDGDIVVSSRTEFAEKGLDALVKYLNQAFGYRMEGPSAKRSFQSTVVVEFERSFTEIIPSLVALQGVLAQKQQAPFEMLRLSFANATGGMPNPQTANPLDGIERTDFTIERRVGSPFSANRFFCTAPMRTREHLDCLEALEQLRA